jgi:hypothetical protein
MPSSPNLSDEQLDEVRKILSEVRLALDGFAKGDSKLLHHARRHVRVQLEYDERGKPMERKVLKATLMAKQGNKCAICQMPLPPKEAELDRACAIGGYTEQNCRVVHHDCHRKDQETKNFA